MKPYHLLHMHIMVAYLQILTTQEKKGINHEHFAHSLGALQTVGVLFRWSKPQTTDIHLINHFWPPNPKPHTPSNLLASIFLSTFNLLSYSRAYYPDLTGFRGPGNHRRLPAYGVGVYCVLQDYIGLYTVIKDYIIVI